MSKLLVAAPPHHCKLPGYSEGFHLSDSRGKDRRGSVFQCDCRKIYVCDDDHMYMRWYLYDPNKRHVSKISKRRRKYYQDFLEAQRD